MLCTFDGKSLFYFVCRSQQHGTDIIFFKIHHNSFDAILEL